MARTIYEIEDDIIQLPLEEQVLLLEMLVHSIRHKIVVDDEDDDAIERMANDPDMQRVLRNEDIGDWDDI